MNDILFVLCFFIIIILFFVTIYYYYKVEYFSSDCNEEEIQSHGGICKPFYGIAPAQAINPYKKNDTVYGLTTTNNSDRYNRNKEAVKIACMNTPTCKGFFINSNVNSDHEGYLCKPEWDGSSYTSPVVDDDVAFRLFKCRSRTNPSPTPAPTVIPHTHSHPPPHSHAPSHTHSGASPATPTTTAAPPGRAEGEDCTLLANPSQCREGLQCKLKYVRTSGFSFALKTICSEP